jgi:hypothetical protein
MTFFVPPDKFSLMTTGITTWFESVTWIGSGYQAIKKSAVQDLDKVKDKLTKKVATKQDITDETMSTLIRGILAEPLFAYQKVGSLPLEHNLVLDVYANEQPGMLLFVNSKMKLPSLVYGQLSQKSAIVYPKESPSLLAMPYQFLVISNEDLFMLYKASKDLDLLKLLFLTETLTMTFESVDPDVMRLQKDIVECHGDLGFNPLTKILSMAKKRLSLIPI